jgi:glycosyltransferase involved in cell wall biosynthesis
MSRRSVGLVAPLPPQIGGVASVAEWLLAHEAEIGCTYDRFDLERPPDAGSGGRLTLAAPLAQLRLLGRFLRWLPRAPKVVHVCVSCTPTGLPRDALYVSLLAATRRRTIAHVHGADLELALQARGRGTALRTIGRIASEVVAVSPRPAAELRAAGIEATHVFNPISARNGGAPSAPRAGGEPLSVVFVGTYGARKGIYELLDAVAAARSLGVRLRIVGPAEHADEATLVAEAISERGLDDVVTLVGPVAPSQVAAELAGADVFCLPSYREGLPMAILEAMAAGVPVVVTAVGGIPDVVVDGESGVVLEPGDADALARALAALADPAARARLGENGRARVEELAGAAIVSARWRELYESAAA